MNRLVTAHRTHVAHPYRSGDLSPSPRGSARRLALLGVLACSLAWGNAASAQMPTGTPPNAPVPSNVNPSEMAVRLDTAMRSGDWPTAIQAFRHLAALPNLTPPQIKAIAAAEERLVSQGVDRGLLRMPSSAFKPLPMIQDAVPMASAGIADPKAETLRLLAIGQSALDRGDAATAYAMAKQAEALGVPESQFGPGQPRVWQLMLDAEAEVKRVGGVVPAGGTMDANGGEQLAFGDQASPGAVVPVQFNQVQSNQGVPVGAENGTEASAAFLQGMQALSSGDKTEARRLFLKAWENQDQLEPTQRNLLQDKLTLLQPRNLSAPSNVDPAELSPIEKAELESQEKTRRLYREITAELAKVEQGKDDAPMDAMDDLKSLRRKVDAAKVDDRAKQSLGIIVDRAIAEHQKFVDSNRADIELDLENDAVRNEMALEKVRQAEIEDEISALVDQFNKLMEERRYPEAELLAKQVRALKPDDPIATSMFHVSRMGTRLMMAEEIEENKDVSFIDNLRAVDEAAVGMNPEFPLEMPDAQRWSELSRIRIGGEETDSSLSPAEREIKRQLTSSVNVKYNNRPLGEVLNDLSAVTGISIVLDEPALSAVRVTPETPVTLQLNTPVQLKSALGLILDRLELAHVIRHDVLMITSVEAKRSNVVNRVYRVADLVTPIPNFASSYEDGLAGALRAAYQMTQPQADIQMMPVSMTDLAGGMAQTMNPAKTNPNVLGQYHPLGGQSGFGVGGPTGGGAGAGGAAFADFESLIDLIQTTIEPDSWEAIGGNGTMREYPQNLSLVISTTSDIHDQIQDLLESLRRLQNLQITIEVRFITLSDMFAENIGVDFDLQFDDNLTQFPTDDTGPSVSVGIEANNVVTDDLDIQINNSLATTAPFGTAGLPGSPTSLGFAILSDIEAFFFLQAAQADSRSNIMQAPKVTLFDGQLASISDQTQTPFVTSITPVVGDFAVAQQPVIVVLNEGTQLNVQGIVSDDKRYVRLTLVPFFSQIGNVDTFTFEGSRSTRSSSIDQEDTNGDGIIDENDAVDTTEDEEIIEGTTVQLPSFAFTTVSTTVSVPDGGTILLGGIKRLSEGRTEVGVPMLSKIPYISRLFRNQAIGRDARSLMLMVTPRIIIQEEEELAQTGFDPNRQ